MPDENSGENKKRKSVAENVIVAYLYKKCRVLTVRGERVRAGGGIFYPALSDSSSAEPVLTVKCHPRLIFSVEEFYRLLLKKYEECLGCIASSDGIAGGTPRLNVDFSASLSARADKLIIKREAVLSFGKERKVYREKDVFSLRGGYLIG